MIWSGFQSANAPSDALDRKARNWIEDALAKRTFPEKESEDLKILRQLLYNHLHPRLMQCQDEMKHLILGLEGRFIAPGPSGAPTRGRIDVLPTGRNFYSIDPRVIPTPTSWLCGKQMAERLLERHQQEYGACPRSIAMVIWGTSNMRTGGMILLKLCGCGDVNQSGNAYPAGLSIFRSIPPTCWDGLGLMCFYGFPVCSGMLSGRP